MSTPKIRIATEADVPAIAAIYRPAVLTGTASFELEPPDEAEIQRRFRAITEGGYPYFVAELDGSIAGYAYANAYRTRPAYRFTVEDSIYVAPDMQGKGIGRPLLRALIETCTAQGFRLMIAIIGDSAQQASIALHRRQASPSAAPSTRSATSSTAGWTALSCSCRWARVTPPRPERSPRRRRQPTASRTLFSSAPSTRLRSLPRLRIRPVAATTE
jgi:L-amino acid N-acyltransferase YncA